MGYDPFAELDRIEEDRRQRIETEQRRKPKGPSGDSFLKRAKDTAESFIAGVDDTVTFGYMDEFGAFMDSTFLGYDYDKRLKYYRDDFDQRQEEHPWATGGGQLAGALVPVFGIGSKAKSAGDIALAGAIEGGLYGSGSADGDLKDRFEGAAVGSALGGATGYVLGGAILPAAKWGGKKALAAFRRGKDPSLIPDTILGKAEWLEKEAARNGDEVSEPATFNAISGKADDELEDGTLLSMRELLGEPGAARKALNKRLGELTEEQAMKIAGRLQKAEAEGKVIDDPQYRSLLGIDMSAEDVTTEQALQAVELQEEAIQKIMEKAGAGKRTFKSMDAQFRSELEKGVTMEDMQKALENSKKGISDARMAKHAIMLAGVQFQRAKQKYLPLIAKGTEGAREEMAEALTKSAHLMAIGKGIVGNAGRTLGYLRESSKLQLSQVADDMMEIESIDALRKRVDGALKNLNDEDLSELLGRLRKLTDVERLEEVLLNPHRAKEYSAWRRTMNSVSLFLRSNALTPATGLFNTISFVGHDLFRNGAAKRWAARRFAKMGAEGEALALRFEADVSRSVYMQAQKRGFDAMLKRLKWEFWTDVEKMASVGWGDGSVAGYAKGVRSNMVKRGYSKPDMREYESKARAAVQDTSAFNAKLAEKKADGGAFANLVYHAMRAGAVATNTLDAVGGAGMKLFTGSIDDWGREFVRLKETYAMSARYAVREAMTKQLPQKEMLKYAEKRAKELAEFPPSKILEEVESTLLRGDELSDDLQFLAGRDSVVDDEAEKVLFMDGPQTSAGRTSAQFARLVDKAAGLGQIEGMVLPYIKTPIRLFERGLVSYTPWGRASKEVQKVLAKGGPEAEIVKAQMEIGMMGIMAGATLGISGGISLTNGGWDNTANLGAGPPNRVNLPGGGYVEMGRLDPFSLTLALGGFVGQAIREGYQDANKYDADQGIHTAIQIAWLSVRDSVLEKSYLTGLQDTLEVLFSDTPDTAATRATRIFNNASSRMVPLSGVSSQITDTVRGDAPESIGWVDKMLRAIPGGSMHLPDRIDPLGDPVAGKTFGIAAGSSNVDEVKKQLRHLGIDITTLNRADPRGFDLTAQELSDLRRIRGHSARNALGQTMREALTELLNDPRFRSLPSEEQKQDAVVDVMREFNESARNIYEHANPDYRADREAYKSLHDYLARGMDRDEAERRATRTVTSGGLPEPDRL